MMFKTVSWFVSAGLFTASMNNVIRGKPALRQPQYHLLYMTIGLAIGYQVHLFQNNLNVRMRKMIDDEKASLLAEKASLLGSIDTIAAAEEDENEDDE